MNFVAAGKAIPEIISPKSAKDAEPATDAKAAADAKSNPGKAEDQNDPSKQVQEPKADQDDAPKTADPAADKDGAGQR